MRVEPKSEARNILSPKVDREINDAVRRVPAVEVEALVGQAVREHLKDSVSPDGDLIRAHVVRVDVQEEHLMIELRVPKQGQASGSENGTLPNRDTCQLVDAVAIEPVSAPNSPANREKNREFLQNPALRGDFRAQTAS